MQEKITCKRITDTECRRRSSHEFEDYSRMGVFLLTNELDLSNI